MAISGSDCSAWKDIVHLDWPRPYRLALSLLLVVAVSTVVVAFFYDQFAYLPDDGTYAFIASRILAGDVLNRDIQDVHAGYINFYNAAALKIFGSTLLSLRLPLALLTIAQAALVFWLVSKVHIGLAILSGIVMAVLTFVQFLNPTANWYCLFFVVALIPMMSSSIESRTKLVLVGAMIGLIFLTRQLNGVIVGVAVLTCLLHEASIHSSSNDRLAARLVLVPLIAVLALYTWRATDIAAFLLIGVWPLLIGTYVAVSARINNQQVFAMVGYLFAGAALAGMPLAAYHAWHGSISFFFDDVVMSALSLSRLGFISQSQYVLYAFDSLSQVVAFETPAKVLNGIFWLILIIAPAILGLTVISRLARGQDSPGITSFVFVSVFYALVSVHYQIPIYLFYSSAMTLIALLLVSGMWRLRYRALIAAMVSFVVVAGLYYQAGQPLSRGIAGIVEGKRVARLPDCAIPKANLRLEEKECATYTRLLADIDRHSRSTDKILALPYSPEIYFLSGRNKPVRYINAALGVRNEEQLKETLAILRANPPVLAVYRPNDKYNTRHTPQIAAWLASTYELIDEFDGFEVYVRTVDSGPQAR